MDAAVAGVFASEGVMRSGSQKSEISCHFAFDRAKSRAYKPRPRRPVRVYLAGGVASLA